LNSPNQFFNLVEYRLPTVPSEQLQVDLRTPLSM
jgi:hypothetical protein